MTGFSLSNRYLESSAAMVMERVAAAEVTAEDSGSAF
jgi:hypothetical protein